MVKKRKVHILPGTDPKALVNVLGLAGGPTYTARFVPVQTRALVTVGVATGRDLAGLCGCIVRVQMLPGDAPDSGAAFASALRDVGVTAVKVVPYATGPAVVVPEHAGPRAVARMSARGVVEAMVADAVGVNKNMLAALVGHVLDKEGL